jgi:hypothetical protein
MMNFVTDNKCLVISSANEHRWLVASNRVVKSNYIFTTFNHMSGKLELTGEVKSLVLSCKNIQDG